MNRIKAFQYHTLQSTYRMERTITYFKRNDPSLVFREPTFSGSTTGHPTSYICPDSMDVNLGELRETVKDKEAGLLLSTGSQESRTRLRP